MTRDLRAMAEAATPGRWVVAGRRGYRASTIQSLGTSDLRTVADLRFKHGDADADHIAAWDPTRALAALDVIEAAAGLDSCELCSQATGTLCDRHRTDIRAALAKWDALP